MTKHIRLSWNDDPDAPMTDGEVLVIAGLLFLSILIVFFQVVLVMAVK